MITIIQKSISHQYEIWIDKCEQIIQLAFIEVKPEYRRKGIATKVVRLCKKYSKKFDFTLYVAVDKDNTVAKNLYAKCGLKEEEPELYTLKKANTNES